MTSRRHFGNVRKLPSGRYQASYWQEGERYVAEATFPAKADAQAYLSSIETEVGRGVWIDPHRADITVRNLGDEWLESNPAKRGSTYARDEAILRRHVYPNIGERRIGSVSPQDIQGLIKKWIVAGKAPKTVRRQYGVARAVFAYAVLSDLLVRTPCRNVKLPAVDRRERYLLSADDVARIAKATGPENEVIVYIGAVLGLRWGEVAGLRVGRLDMLRGTLFVAEQITRSAKGKPESGPPKSEAGRRTLAMPVALVDLLAEHLRRRGLTAVDADEFVFVAPDGGSLTYGNWRRRVWVPACEAVGLKGVGFHDLRRAAATALVAGGVDVKTAQGRLGHSDSRITLELYAQVTTEADRAAAEVVGERFLPTIAHAARTAGKR